MLCVTGNGPIDVEESRHADAGRTLRPGYHDDPMKTLADTIVEENNHATDFDVAKGAGERASEHRYVVTVPRRGYSFVAEVIYATQVRPECCC